MDTMSSIDKQECLNRNGLRHKSSVLLISALCSLIFVGLTCFFIFYCLSTLEEQPFFYLRYVPPHSPHLRETVKRWSHKSFLHQVWWKITIVWELSGPSAHITHLDAQKCHSQETSDILETLQFANNRHFSERETRLLTTQRRGQLYDKFLFRHERRSTSKNGLLRAERHSFCQ